jgi:CDP-2,3-bis-(O-geranylgeranyl)-sn-glycerol synthase
MRVSAAAEPVTALLLLRLLILLVLANGVPLAARTLIGDRWSAPVDGDRRFVDGRPIFGRSKTIRGAALAILATTAAAPLLGLEWRIGAVVGAVAMAGDLFSSFCKRRLGLPPSRPALGLDQIPEALFPLLACKMLLALPLSGIALLVAIFFAGEVVLSRLLYAFRLRDRPY